MDSKYESPGKLSLGNFSTLNKKKVIRNDKEMFGHPGSATSNVV